MFFWNSLAFSIIYFFMDFGIIIYRLDLSMISYLDPVCCPISSSNCCFLTCIQISQEADQVVWYPCLLKNFPQFVVMHLVKGFGVVNKVSGMLEGLKQSLCTPGPRTPQRLSQNGV